MHELRRVKAYSPSTVLLDKPPNALVCQRKLIGVSQSMTLWEIYDAGTFYSICILSCFIAGEIFSLQLHVKKKDALAGHPSRFVQVKCKEANVARYRFYSMLRHVSDWSLVVGDFGYTF